MTLVIRNSTELQEKVAAWKRSGMLVGVVPTMGALHDGHLSLVKTARAQSDRVIVTIFVNPMQFNNTDDLAKYPRHEERDLTLLEAAGVDVLFAPDVTEVYPDGFATTVSVSGVTAPMEGEHRPGHFDGMATVVAKLFGMTQAGSAFFGEKDWQQLQVVKRMVRDLNLPITVVGCPTIREEDGLAMSSRNVRLSAEERALAPELHRILQEVAAKLRAGQAVESALAEARAELAAKGFGAVDYLDFRSGESLAPLEAFAENGRLLVALSLGQVRMIDNIAV
ncbi:pantoate--beta-alanine ligase [Thioclava kandeliae]|uniref:Pantothenate synthetase n=1 Tax=Thioclava kandeliae TaxID=3070818 RepID=A0ABV1SLH6_9RHOB